MAAPRIGPKQAKGDMKAADALLVCAYDSKEKFEANRLEDAIALDDLKGREGSLTKQRELIFYCA